MLGAIIGDTVGSIYEFVNIKTPYFEPFIGEQADYTDDSIMSVAVADWLLSTNRTQSSLESKLCAWAQKYPCPMGDYGTMFRKWLFEPEDSSMARGLSKDNPVYGKRFPYNSCGNGSAMRVSACGWLGTSLDETLDLAKRSAEITHNHPEGIKGAQATAAAIYMARHGETKEVIRDYIEQKFGYNLHQSCGEIRPTYQWDGTCQGTVPQAIVAWLDSSSFEEAVRLAVSLGGDSDTLACITGGIAEAYATAHNERGEADFYEGITHEMLEKMKTILPDDMWDVVRRIALLNGKC